MRITILAVLTLALSVCTALAQTTSRQAAPPAPAASAAPQINLNTATAMQLESLPGVGPAVAERIVMYRQQSGGFKKIEELMNVRGIGEAIFLKIRPLVTVTVTRADADSR